MTPFTKLTAVAAPLDLANIDTDKIIPARFLRRLRGPGYEKLAFHDIRYDAHGNDRPDFILNQAPYRNSGILVAGANFGCGSSREAAVWALLDAGIRCVIAPSFGDIFTENSYKNGLLPLTLDASAVSALCDVLATSASPVLGVDLKTCTVTACDGRAIPFQIPPRRREALLSGTDEMAAILAHRTEIARFQASDRARRPWVYATSAASPAVGNKERPQ